MTADRDVIPQVSRVLLARRLVRICWEVGVTGVRLVGARLAGRLLPWRRPPDHQYRALTRGVERLGPTFIKLAQVAGTRTDLLPPRLCQLLDGLYDQVRTMPAAAVADAVPAALLASVVGGVRGMEPVGAGSVACVYRARLRSGEVVAVKVLRPGIHATMAADLALLIATARAVQRLRWFRGLPMAEIVLQLGTCIMQQLDLEREAAALGTLRRNLARAEGVRVPAVRSTWSTPDVLVLEYIDGLRRSPSEPGSSTRRIAMLRALRAGYQMLFIDGFVHCDLHPGNLYPMPDGSVVITDAGFSVQLADVVRHKFTEFFLQLGQGNGRRCADIVLSTARRAAPGADVGEFRAALTALVDRSTRRSMAEFSLVKFATDLFSIQRRCGFLADPQFVYPILSLIVLEGALREACHDVDFQAEALPFLLRGLMATGSRGAAARRGAAQPRGEASSSVAALDSRNSIR